ncbi:54S ribosomal protein L32 [Penicillium malachiteum]|uniref:54S ribosomal protein L32 n=1 Tax=Penicillium malachiteum TaxID=1324776 RepID=UPI002547E2E4|nr:54S ribosomal protein L32 [Penicillium malachiteum]KAJ5714284.1 54S ribosomal protein L32 [Penicillium malachiteum]
MALSMMSPLSRAVPQLPRFGLLATAISLPSISVTIPPFLSDLWDSVLRAVPKKKTSHMKKRHRQMAGKALKDVENLNKCPGCGQVKRAHLLCPHCVNGTWSLDPRSLEEGFAQISGGVDGVYGAAEEYQWRKIINC